MMELSDVELWQQAEDERLEYEALVMTSEYRNNIGTKVFELGLHFEGLQKK